MGRKKKVVESAVNVVSASEKLGVDLIDKIAEKDWKTSPPPTEVELKKEEPRTPKVRSNPNSRKNLAQYNPDTSKETKEKILGGLPIKEKRPEVNPLDYINLPEGIDVNEFLTLLPNTRLVFYNEKEEKRFFSIVNVYLSGFDYSELSASDIADIVDLAKNSILEDRLLAATKPVPGKDGDLEQKVSLLDISTTIEKFRKHSAAIKGNLSNRRIDRIDPKNRQNFSIVDIVYAYDDKMKEDFRKRIEDMERENKEYLAEKANREDKVFDGDE
jgi:hypothetical protein